MNNGNVVHELLHSGERNERATQLFNQVFDNLMTKHSGDIGRAMAEMLELSSSINELNEAIVFKMLAGFVAEARAAQTVLVMSPKERLEHCQQLFNRRFQEGMHANAGNPVATVEQMLGDALTDGQLGSAIIYQHLCFFLEHLGKQVAPAPQAASLN